MIHVLERLLALGDVRVESFADGGIQGRLLVALQRLLPNLGRALRRVSCAADLPGLIGGQSDSSGL